MSRRIVVIGGGIAGLAAAWWLARKGAGFVVVVERERQLCSRASGKNAGILRPFESVPPLVTLCARTQELLAELDGRLLSQSGLLLLSSTEQLEGLAKVASQQGVASTLLEPSEVRGRFAELAATDLAGLFTRQGGALDLELLGQSLENQLALHNVNVRRYTQALGLQHDDGGVSGVRLDDNEIVETDLVVLAAGAWCAALLKPLGSKVSLLRERRHLAVLEAEPPLLERLPVVWRLEDEVYVRRFGEQALACPCDHDPWHEDVPRLESHCLGVLPQKLSSLIPRLRTAPIQRAWACLRTFTEDRLPLIGFEPRVPGLAWLAGLGGFGMSTGLAAGELLAEIVLGKEQPTWCDPGRFSD